VVAALHDGNIEIIHSTDSNITISVLVPEEDAMRAEQLVHDSFRLGRSPDKTLPEMTAGGTR
jgi:aspartokinase